jgi:Cu/Ag efflux pump CusA
MLDSIIAWSLSRRLMVLLGAAVVCLVGWVAVRGLVIDAFPDTTPVQVQINTVAAGMVAEEVERQITFPVELAMGGMPGLEDIRSASMFGLSVVIVTFRDGTDIYFARQLINERLGTVEVPPGVARPEMGPVSTGLGEVFHYLLVPKGMSLTDVKTLQEWTLKPALRAVPGVAEVNAWGGLNKQYQIRVDPGLLRRYDLSFDQVVEAVPRNNFNVGGGSIDRSGDAVLVYGVGRTVDPEQIGRIVIASRDGVPIRIRDVGEVFIGHEIRKGVVTAGGEGEVVLGLGFMLMGENSYAVTTRLRDRFEKLLRTLPEGVEAKVVYDRTKLIDRVIATVRQNLLEGAFLVVVILYIMLGNLRAGLVAATAIPLSMMFGFIGMWQAGIAASLLSLGAIDFGIVVDSSVVVIESILEKIAHHPGATGAARLKLVMEATSAVKKPACFGQLIIMIVYIPILSLEGVEGKMFRPMAMTVIFILIGSLVLSLTVVPVLSSIFLPKRVDAHDVFLVRLLRSLYRPALRACLSARGTLAMVATALLFITFLRASTLGTEFVPKLSEGDIVLGIIRAPGTSLEESARMNTRIEKALLDAFPHEVAAVWSRGRHAGGGHRRRCHRGNRRLHRPAPPRGVEGCPDAGRPCRGDEQDRRGDSGADHLVYPADRAADQRDGVGGAGRHRREGVWHRSRPARHQGQRSGGGDPQGAGGGRRRRRAGRRPADPQSRRSPGRDRPLRDLRQGGARRHRERRRQGRRPDRRGAIPVPDRRPPPGGPSHRPRSVCQHSAPLPGRRDRSPRPDRRHRHDPRTEVRDARVERAARRRAVQRPRPRRGGFVAEAQGAIAEAVELPEEQFRLVWGGQFENMQRAQKRLAIVVPLALLLIIALLHLTYRNVADTTLLFVSVPFACVGGIWALAAREMPLSISAAVGFITLSGVSVLNGMVLASALRDRLARGTSRDVAIEETASASLRTIVMTALVASLGFIPMAVSEGTGAEVQRPLATVVIGGVITSTLYTLFVLPALYRLVLGVPPAPQLPKEWAAKD